MGDLSWRPDLRATKSGGRAESDVNRESSIFLTEKTNNGNVIGKVFKKVFLEPDRNIMIISSRHNGKIKSRKPARVKSALRLFLNTALRIPTAHDFRLISGCTHKT